MEESVSDLRILCHEILRLYSMLQKANDATRKNGIDPLFEKIPLSWVVCLDKGYQGRQNDMRAAHPVKRTPGNRLSHGERSFDASISFVRVNMEQSCGREVCLKAILLHRLRLQEENFDNITKMCRASTERHMIQSPLAERDEESFAKV